MSHPGTHHGAAHTPRLIAWEVTRSCMLACKHCRAAARPEPYEGELSTEDSFKLLDNIAAFSRPIIILTGGEPMLRPDIYDIAEYAHRLGLPVVMAPCGLLIDDAAAKKIVKSGIRRISISLDGATAESHDGFRGVPGAFYSAIRGIEAAKRARLDFQINTTISRHNLADLEAIRDLAIELGASVFNPFLLVPTGRGKALADQEISPDEYEQTLHWLARQRETSGIQIRVTCAPHYQRIMRETGVPPEPRQGGGCMGGKAFAFISHIGKVQICGFLETECGDLRREDLDFRKVWETSPFLQRIRDVDSYHGRCGHCEYRKLCGGCRARAFAISGDELAEEPYCVYQPKARRRPALDEPHAADDLDDIEKRVLSAIQAYLPVDEQPYDALGERLNFPGGTVLCTVAGLKARGIIRRVGPVFDSKRLGYISTLVAAAVPPDKLDETAALVSALAGVTHNYRRDHRFNLWFTLTSPSADGIEQTLADLRDKTGAEFHSLPALAVYKIKVELQVGSPSPGSQPPPKRTPGEPVGLDEQQKELVRLLQDDIPDEPRPFDKAAERLGWTPQRVVDQIREWVDAGVVRRFGAVVRHHRLGYVANGMCVFNVPEERIDAIGEQLAAIPDISHCYRRPPLPWWEYNLFAMVHGRSREQVLDLAAKLAAEFDLAEYDVLFSTEEYKKTSMRYFVE